MAEAPGAWAPPLGAAQDAALLGGVQVTEGAALGGWLQDPSRPLWPVIFGLEVNGAALGRHIANLPLAVAPPGIPPHAPLGFRVALPPGLLRPGANTALFFTGDGQRRLELAFRHGPAAAEPPKPSEPGPPDPRPASAAEDAEIAKLLGRLEPEQIAALVEKAFQSRQWNVVLALTGGSLAGKSRDARLVTWRGRAFYYLGRHAEAVEALRWIQARYPQRHTALLFLARSLGHLGQLEEARRILQNSLAAYPDEPRYLLESGRIAARLAQGDDGQVEPRPELAEEAQQLLHRAATMRPQDHRPLRALAHLVLHAGRLPDALEHLEAAIARAPDQPELHMERARLLTRLGRIEAALEAAETAAALDPSRGGAGFAVRILQRWLEARHAGPLASLVGVRTG
ncbi:tetratricopeptide repeat protein [Sediminicoccus sp. KRV36]|uniref:tetratricopeptide repeat protein n=1 Tax=Sediminicoccus sp. KRV36 TaxID=3133721 RepID=UPI00200D173D|nr:tetratricopeptide repeat protein [Sediminicoccus rosea]UPY36958.1 tetratricopeptide repeat protein [Sediminicoccus rosea]